MSARRESLTLRGNLIAPCGMNCGLCISYVRERNRCAGCRSDNAHKPKHCVTCRIVRCEHLATASQPFCFQCETVPCTRLRQLDKRYRTTYGMSMIENLETLREIGLDAFVAREQRRWRCPTCGALLCVHRADCMACGAARPVGADSSAKG